MRSPNLYSDVLRQPDQFVVIGQSWIVRRVRKRIDEDQLHAPGAGAASRRSLGTAVFGGMVAASILVPLFVPVFYSVVQRIREKVPGAGKAQVADGSA
ncbi:MAG: hypothetical protein DRR03_03570 [Gammaproteobacteria bacterium]|nr:MAG: hypothetical protein DRR03_03570 [Gammaproteobacteria bacterium]